MLFRSGMHYTGMAAMRVHADATGSMASMGGASAISFIVPLLAGISLLMFGLTLAITLSPSEAEIHEDAVLQRRMETEFADGLQVNSRGADFPVSPAQVPGRAAPRGGVSDAFTPGGYANGNGNANGSTGGNLFGGDQPGPSARPLPTRRPPRDGGGRPGGA